MSKKIIHDPWETYVAGGEEGPMFISFDEEAAQTDLSDELPHCARVTIPIHDPNENGGPVSPEAEHLYDMEDRLVAALTKHKVYCRLVGRITYNGQRELVFQFADPETFRPPVAQWMSKHQDYEMDVSEHDGWEFFNKFVCPSTEDWLCIMDRRVIENLDEAGSNMKKKHALEYVFHGSDASLRKIVQALEKRGYVPEGELDYASGEIMMAKKMKLELADVNEESLANHGLAEQHDATCDGWGAMVME